MSTRRKDHKGRVLKMGECQRNNLTYEYRYIDSLGNRRSVYAPTLVELREKEEKIQRQLMFNDNYAAGEITVMEMVEHYLSTKHGVRQSTKVGYRFVLGVLRKEEFATRKINTIKVSDVKRWVVKLHNDGRGYSTICSIRGVLKPAFQMASDEDVIRKNPFTFKLTDVIPNDSEHRIALTKEQQESWLNFVREDETYRKYYDEFIVLLQTGMRVSEFCGLTKKDLDFEKRRIHVNKQLIRVNGVGYLVEKPKTKSGDRFILMSDQVYQSLKNILANRPKVKTEMIVDGYKGFIMLDQNGKPKIALHIENEIRWSLKKYSTLYPDNPLPHITPHVLRHTFCTNMACAGMDISCLQYMMGHADAGVTLNVYTHVRYETAAAQMARIINFGLPAREENERKIV